jgi:hypothetical protein
MKTKIIFTVSIFLFSIISYSQNKPTVNGIVKYNNAKTYSFFSAEDKYLSEILQKGDTIIIYSCYQGSASKNILFWKGIINEKKYYIPNYAIEQSEELTALKLLIDNEVYLKNKKNDSLKIAELIDLFGETTTNKILKEEIWLGMTIDMARKSIGVPSKINTSTGSWGVHQQWVYREKDMYLYFENGRLTSIQD